MWPFSKKDKPYLRSSSMAAAAKARASGDFKKAIAEYQKVIEREPDNTDVHGKIAPLLAQAQQYKQAWKSFEICADGFKKKGFVDKAISVYAQAADFLPGLPDVWERMATLHLERLRKPDAVKVLLKGRTYFKTREYRPDAIRLLSRARELEPNNLEMCLDLASLLRLSGRRAEGLAVLTPLLPGQRGKQLRRLRGSLWRLQPTPARLWHYLRALFLGR